LAYPLCLLCPLFFFKLSPTTEIYTLSLHDALPICDSPGADSETVSVRNVVLPDQKATIRSESDLGKHLVARQRPGDGILSSLRRIRVLRQNSRSNSSKQDPKNKRLPRAQR